MADHRLKRLGSFKTGSSKPAVADASRFGDYAPLNVSERTNYQVLWDAVQTDLPALCETVEQMLNDLDAGISASG